MPSLARRLSRLVVPLAAALGLLAGGAKASPDQTWELPTAIEPGEQAPTEP